MATERRVMIEEALAAARDTRRIEIVPGRLAAVPEIFRAEFGRRAALVVADRNTWRAAGAAVHEALERSGVACERPFLFEEPDLHADWESVLSLESRIAASGAVPVCAGSGTLNDLAKLAAHRAGTQYLCAATAASVDGYTAFGASITRNGSKETFACPAAAVVLADLEVIAGAPPELNAAGYADLQAKLTGGADWLLAETAGADPIDERAWELAQGRLPRALSDPAGVRRGDAAALRALLEGLMLCGIAMQWTGTSRPASGAEHLFSHVWDMEGHTHQGRTPLHGFKVGIATLAVARLYERLYELPVEGLNVEQAVRDWPDAGEMERHLEKLFPPGPLREKCREESLAKHPGPEALRVELERLRAAWPELLPRLRRQLPPAGELQRRLTEAGAPVHPEEIGISLERLRRTCRQAAHLRRRYTVLDFLARTGLLEQCLHGIAREAS